MSINKLKKVVERNIPKPYNVFLEVSEKDYLVFEFKEHYLYFNVNFSKGGYNIEKTYVNSDLKIISKVACKKRDLIYTSQYIINSIINFKRGLKNV